MNLIVLIAFVLIVFFAAKPVYRLLSHKSLYPLLPKEYNFKKRRNSFKLTLKLIEERHAKVLVETGVARKGLQNTKYDGASTIVFGLWAKHHQAVLHSVDIDSAAIEEARKEVEKCDISDAVKLNTSDSVAFLKQFSGQVDFLYLDSYDYPKRDPEGQQASREHHFKEIIAIEPNLHDNSLVLIDDCGRQGGGKGLLVIKYLKDRGWKEIYKGYQVLLSK
ncbi:MAG: class I SAM-dependent methyltransferase [Cyclobacteriaceae bacterium]|nr:class I SAM-dependent methyltransferase [Cyclobacteriaceae bacterium]